jgi:hypothetical protein
MVPNLKFAKQLSGGKMSTIHITNLNPTGSDLLFDAESYLSELAEEELFLVEGGYPTVTQTMYTSTWCIAAQLATQTPNAYKISYNVSYNLGKR